MNAGVMDEYEKMILEYVEWLDEFRRLVDLFGMEAMKATDCHICEGAVPFVAEDNGYADCGCASI
jgi:hypothetical protein